MLKKYCSEISLKSLNNYPLYAGFLNLLWSSSRSTNSDSASFGNWLFYWLHHNWGIFSRCLRQAFDHDVKFKNVQAWYFSSGRPENMPPYYTKQSEIYSIWWLPHSWPLAGPRLALCLGYCGWVVFYTDWTLQRPFLFPNFTAHILSRRLNNCDWEAWFVAEFFDIDIYLACEDYVGTEDEVQLSDSHDASKRGCVHCVKSIADYLQRHQRSVQSKFIST